MQVKKDHFIIGENAITQGQCTEFISQQEQLWRTVDILEEPPLKRISAYTRNVQYQPHNTRTFPVLKAALKYLFDEIFPLLFDPNKPHKERQHIVLFLQERLIAIRCEYFVQGIVCPRQLLKILRGMLVVETMRGFNSGNRPLVGLQLMMEAEVQPTMESQFSQEYLQALKMSIVCSKRRDLQKLLLNHPAILDDEQLSRLLELKLKVEQNNYHAFYAALEGEEALVRCLLWLQIGTVKTTFIEIAQKSFMDLPAKWLYRRLCLDSQSKDGWINLKKNPQILEIEETSYLYWIDLQTLRRVVVE